MKLEHEQTNKGPRMSKKYLMIKFLKLSDEPKLSPDKPIFLSDRKCNLSNSVTNSFTIDSVFYEFYFSGFDEMAYDDENDAPHRRMRRQQESFGGGSSGGRTWCGKSMCIIIQFYFSF